MVDYFPMLQPEIIENEVETLPLYRECGWDFKKGEPVFENGEPKMVEGKEGIKVWIWKTLHTPLGKHEIYDHTHGHQLEDLISQSFIEETRRAEAIRYVVEALEVNPYITKVKNVTVLFSGSALTIEVTCDTVYGEVGVDVF